MKKNIMLIILVQLSLSFISANVSAIDQEHYYILTGVWVDEIRDMDYPTETFSWGDSIIHPLSSYIIDLGADNPYFSNMASVFQLRSIVENNTYEVVFEVFDQYSDFSMLTVNIDECGRIGFLEFGPIVDTNPLIKLDGPTPPFDGPYFTPTAALRLRAGSTLDHNILLTMAPGRLFIIIETGREETINNVTGNWLHVRLLDGTEGWCFGGYVRESILNRQLEEMKNR